MKILLGNELAQVKGVFEASGLDFDTEIKQDFVGFKGVIQALEDRIGNMMEEVKGLQALQGENETLKAELANVKAEKAEVIAETLKADRETPKIEGSDNAPVDHSAIFLAMPAGKAKAEYYDKYIKQNTQGGNK